MALTADLRPRFAQIALARPKLEPLTYSIPESLQNDILLGQVVEVPLGRSRSRGFVLGFVEQCSFETKDILSISVQKPVFSAQSLQFFKWIAEYYRSSLGEVLHTAIPQTLVRQPKRVPAKAQPKQTTTCNTNYKIESHSKIQLNDQQKKALQLIADTLQPCSQKNKSFLLHGITGSGKTEVYLNCVEIALQMNLTTIVLVPEIALTPQLRERFEARFPGQVAILHSSLSEKDRRNFWQDLQAGEKKIALGARSAIFAPLENLGLIIVDEEHEPSYKQADHLRYHARDLALVRGKICNATVVLGSATPSIESYYLAKQGKHQLVRLTDRANAKALPQVQMIDLRKDKLQKGQILSQKLLTEIHNTLAQNEQIILFYNRKGFAQFLLCKDCGFVPKCNHCSVSKTYYQRARILKCHYCGFTEPAPDHCEKCFSRELKFMGSGTESLYDELSKHVDGSLVSRIDSDAISNLKDLEKHLKDFRDGKTKILVGTQMLAKGHDFPNVTLVGIVTAEMGLYLPDFRAAERTFQLLTQVAGRSGRGTKLGKVLLQTYDPDHYAIQYAMTQNFENFYDQEILLRREAQFPPFFRSAQIEFKARTDETARKYADNIAGTLKSLREQHNLEIQILGPAPAMIHKLNREYRWQIMLKAEKSSTLNQVLKSIDKLSTGKIDVDPMQSL